MNCPHQEIWFAIFKQVSYQFLRLLMGVCHKAYTVLDEEVEGNGETFEYLSVDE